MPGFDQIARRPGQVVALVLAVTGLALVPALGLRVNTDLTDLLPDGSRAAADYRVFLERFGGLEKVFVLIRSAPAADLDEADLIHAASLLEEVLAESPEVASVRAGFGPEDEEFFLRFVVPRAALLAGSDREEVARRLEPEAIRGRVARLKAALKTPSGAVEVRLARIDPLGLSDGLMDSMSPAAIPVDFLTSTFLSPAGDAALVILSPARSEVDAEGGRALLAELEGAYGEVRERLGAGFELHAVGGPLYAAQDELALRRDLRRTLAGSLLATALILIAAFEGWVVPAALLAPLLVALVWTAAWLGLVRGEVTAISVGFAAVLVGLGIDYGIHAGARFRQAYLVRTAGGAGSVSPGRAAAALAETARHAGPGILTSALTTAAGFAVLGLAHFRLLRDLGALVTAGILAILAAVVVLGSAVLVLAARRLTAPGPLWRVLGETVTGLAGFSRRRPALVLAAAAALTAGALWGVRGLSVDADLTALRPVNHPVHEAEELLVDRFGVGLDTATVVVHGRDLPAALARAEDAGRLLRSALPAEVEISSPADFTVLGERARQRARELAGLPLARAADDLERELVAANLDPRAFAGGLEILRRLARGEEPAPPPPPEAWPDGFAESLAVGADGAWVAIHLRLPAGTWPEGPPPDLVAQLVDEVPESAFASALAIGSELKKLAARDLRTLSLWAMAAVVLVVTASFRGRLLATAAAMLPVVLGSLWSVGLWSAAGRSLDLFTLAVLPILLGIGIDDGLHVVHGARRGATAGAALYDAVRQAGRALALTTLTTCAGFASLVLSHVPGLRNGGLLISAGVAACLLATVMVLPAIEALYSGSGPGSRHLSEVRERRRDRRRDG